MSQWDMWSVRVMVIHALFTQHWLHFSYNVVTNYAGVVLSKTLSRTEMIYTHGLHLISTVDPQTLEKQVIFSEGIDHNDLNSIAETIIIC